MKAGPGFSCYLIGDDSLVLRCAEIILQKNNQLLGIVSTTDIIVKWCKENNIRLFPSIAEYENQLNHDYDYLFSIVNSKILSDKILSTPRKLAINYHDSPLPKYAGLNATSWAIINNEKKHAVSWHVMQSGIDTGDILKQPKFDINDTDTALSLNLKCYQHAISSFRSLVKELANNTYKRSTQDLSKRSYYGSASKPKNLGFIDWNQPAEDIDRFLRAVNFGNYRNTLTTAKLLINNTPLVVKGYKLTNTKSTAAPGKITSMCDIHIQIATQTTDIQINKLAHLDGQHCYIEEACKPLNNHRQLKIPTDKLLKQLEATIKTTVKYEKFWLKMLAEISPSELSIPSNKVAKYTASKRPLTIPSKINNAIKLTHGKDKTTINYLITAILIYFYKLNSYDNFSTLLKSDKTSKALENLTTYINDFSLIHSNLDAEISFNDAQTKTSKLLSLIETKGYCTKELIASDSHNRKKIELIEMELSIVKSMANAGVSANKKINIQIAQNGKQFRVVYKPNSNSNSKAIVLREIGKDILNLLKHAVENPEQKIATLPMARKKELNTILHRWNNTKAVIPSKSVVDLFCEQAKKTPNAIAAAFKNQQLSYKKLDEISNIIAKELIQAGATPNTPIGIHTDRSMELIVAIISTLKAGCPYLPLDPIYPAERLNYIAKDSKINIIITNTDSNIHFSKENYQLFNIQSCHEQTASDKTICPINLSKSSNLAYLIYTSGTTGNPKGVAISHRALTNHMLWMKNQFDFKPKDNFLQKTPYCFDASVWEFFMPIICGATLVIAPPNVHKYPEQLINVVKDNHITVLQLVPSMLNELLNHPNFKQGHSLKNVFCGGESLSQNTIKKFYEHTNARLHNLYGPTEATIEVTHMPVTKQQAQTGHNYIGKPITNTQLYVLDQCMQPLPIGVTGELYIGGAGLSKGYINRTDLTNDKFLPNPFSRNKKSKLYKTSDLVRWHENGCLEYIGRSDTQIKLRGFRIELSEIEVGLEKLPFVDQAIVLTENDSTNSTQILTAYLTLSKEKISITVEMISSLLEKHLPYYMLPNKYCIVDKFQTTTNGKINKNILSTTPNICVLADLNKVPPKNDIEEKLLKIWQEVLCLKNIGTNDNFFNIGGHSLSALRIMLLIEKNFAIKLDIGKLFSYPTITKLATALNHNTERQNTDIETLAKTSVIPLKTDGNKPPLFLIHPIGGGVFGYHELAKHIEDRPIYAIQDPGIATSSFVISTIEEMAELYLKFIKSIQPSGPYFLAGASFGSTIIIEMANQLAKRHQKVHYLGLIDGWAFYPELSRNKQLFMDHMSDVNKLNINSISENHPIDIEFLVELQWHREKMLKAYQLPNIKHKLTLYKAKELSPLFQYKADFNWWENFARKPITRHLVPGDHNSMLMKPNARILAKRINLDLAAAIENAYQVTPLSVPDQYLEPRFIPKSTYGHLYYDLKIPMNPQHDVPCALITK